MTQRSLAEFVSLGILHLEETSAQHLYSVNHEHLLVADALAPLFRAEERRVGAVFDEIRRLLAETEQGLDAGVETVVLFGNAARGDDSPGSDLDLLVVTRAAAGAEPVHDLLSARAPDLRARFGVILSPVVVGLGEFRRQARTGDAFVRDALRDGRLVCGRPLEEVAHG